MDFKHYIESIKDFPKEGILYRDIQPLLENEDVFYKAVMEMGKMVLRDKKPEYFVGIESRGFIFATALCMKWGGGLKLIRKRGKLPNNDLAFMRYELEYGSDWIEMKKGKGTVCIVDDVYATGGTMEAAEKLCKEAGYEVIDKICLVDIGIKENNIKSLIKY